jgi:hypothetical protein
MSPHQRRPWTAALLACMALAAARAGADEARIPVYQPTTLSQSGYYILTRNVTSTSGSAITITAQDVTLDLNGFTITGPTGSVLVTISSGANASVRIRNGFLIGASGTVVSRSSGLILSLERIAALDFGNVGLDLLGTAHLEVVRSQIRSSIAADVAIGVRGPTGVPVSGRIERSTLSSPAGNLIVVLPKNWVIEDSIFLDGDGIVLVDQGVSIADVGDNLVKDNTFHGGGVGLSIPPFAPGNQVRGNVFTVGASGLHIKSNDNTVAENLVGGGTPSAACPGAICIEGARNLVERNLTEGTLSGCGIAFSGSSATDNAYRFNMLRGNATSGVCVSGGATATDAGGNIL